ncbi:retention module-containing protein, partial [Castellaniella sp.]|uniref:retention module-containing protein n=1 Tax=Castellaniella sp. TaxID=1955812 RepID=UPI003568CB58
MATILVSKLVGDASVRGQDGQLHPLREGMRIPVDAEIVTARGALLELSAEGIPLIRIGEQRVVQLDASIMQPDIDASEAAVMPPADADTERLITLLEDNQDPFDVLDPTAATTATAGVDGGGSSFVRLMRIVEQTTPLDVAYPHSAPGEDDDRLFAGLTAAGADGEAVDPDLVPGVTTLTLSSPETVVEGNPYLVTATVSNPVTGSPLVITLTNGAVIVIPVGEVSGSVLIDTREDDVYLQGDEPHVIGVESIDGGRYQELVVGGDTTTVVTDDDDPTEITLEGPASVVEGEDITIVAHVSNPPQNTDLVIQLDNGQTITIPVGSTSGSVTYPARADDELVQGDIAESVSIESASGGNYENLIAEGSVTTNVLDNDVPQITVSDVVISEGDTGTFDVDFGNPVDHPTTVTLELAYGTGDGQADHDDVNFDVPPVVTIGGVGVPVVDNGDGTFSFELPA